MAGLINVSNDADDPRDVERRVTTEAALNSGTSSRSYVQTKVAEQVALRAPKTYVDNQDSNYATAAYFAAQDALLVPNASKGAPNGLATLSSGKVPVAQVPVFGAGIIQGPWGATTTFGGTTTGTTPLKIAQWNAAVYGVIGQPLVCFQTSVMSTDGRPVIEIRIGNSTQTTYESQTLIGQGYGGTLYADYQIVSVLPAVAALNEGADGVQDNFAPATSWLINAWLINDGNGTSTTSVGSVVTAALYWMRTAL